MDIRRDFLQVMTIATGHVGLPLPPPLIPKLASHVREGFKGLSNPLQVAFVSPALPDIWKYVEASWQQPQTAGLANFL